MLAPLDAYTRFVSTLLLSFFLFSFPKVKGFFIFDDARFLNVARIDRNGNRNGETEEFSLVYLRYKNSSGKRPQQSPRKHLEVHLAGVPVHKHVPPDTTALM